LATLGRGLQRSKDRISTVLPNPISSARMPENQGSVNIRTADWFGIQITRMCKSLKVRFRAMAREPFWFSRQLGGQLVGTALYHSMVLRLWSRRRSSRGRSSRGRSSRRHSKRASFVTRQRLSRLAFSRKW
jgi:hypothetical protein